ncbi:glycoside hydrolase family 15 protein [Leekyejoonella antrihumi]|uniref:Glycoside hydrolase family 15 protein n=1 Tax=Leekyejoonella antrihumi TaxID=1660198 RepID=A0A563DVA4_9MICO|nr:glycoside hydrolase family 15 protein [Leekyejoonella antrihumi]
MTRDADGFAPIGAYAVLGDGRGVALLAADGSVDWWAVPRLDSTPAVAALLDPERGGRIRLSPADVKATYEWRYLPHTNLVETTWTTDTGRVRVTDSLNSGRAGALPWGELARRIDGLDGTVAMRLLVQPGDGMRQWRPWVKDDDRGPIVHAGSLIMGVIGSEQIKLESSHDRVEASFEVAAGERRVIGVVAADGDPLFMCHVDAIDKRIDISAQSWRDWAASVQWEGAGREQIVRSALALKTLIIAETGAIAAAATTSLPESIGGPKNWDYRYSWIRDAVFTMDALSLLGQQEEVHAAVTWLLRAIHANGPDVRVMYTLSGGEPDGVRTPDIPGYQHSLPVQLGNSAAGQKQLGVYGDLFGTIAHWIFRGHVLDVGSNRELADLADLCADEWRRDDAGIWELHTNRPYTSSKMNCWRALDAAARLAEAGHLVGSGVRWRGEADVIRTWVNENCWSQEKQAYTFYAGSDDLDASVLLGAQTGFDTGPRMSSTIDALGVELGAGPMLYRYTGVHREEATFTACSFWRVQALALVGRVDEAQSLLNQLHAVAGPLGLMAEMCVPGTNEQLGNLPQALSHLSHIEATAAVRAARADG